MLFFIKTLLHRYGQIVRFLISGGTAFVTTISVLYFFTGILGVWYLESSLIAMGCAFIVSFTLQKFWTFRRKEKNGTFAQLLQSLCLFFVNISINTLLMYFFVEDIHLHYLIAQVILAFLMAIETYFVYKHFIFKLKTTSN